MSEDERDLIERVARHLQRPVPLDPGLSARVMAQVLAERPSQRRPRVLMASLGALAAAAGLAVLLVTGPRSVQPSAAVRFSFVAPRAMSVTLVGDFNDWKVGSLPLSRVQSGSRWEVIVPLPSGRYNYAFVIDGTHWVPDPTAPRAAGDDFGTPNSVVVVSAGAASL